MWIKKEEYYYKISQKKVDQEKRLQITKVAKRGPRKSGGDIDQLKKKYVSTNCELTDVFFDQLQSN